MQTRKSPRRMRYCAAAIPPGAFQHGRLCLARSEFERAGARSKLERAGARSKLERTGARSKLERTGARSKLERAGARSEFERALVVRQTARQIFPVKIEPFDQRSRLLGGQQVLFGKKIDERTFGERRNFQGIHVFR